MKMKLTLKQANALLPQTLRMTYGWKDMLEAAVQFEHGVHEIDCVDDPTSKGEYIAVYKLIRVERAK